MFFVGILLICQRPLLSCAAPRVSARGARERESFSFDDKEGRREAGHGRALMLDGEESLGGGVA